MTDEQYEKDKFLPYWAQQWPACLPLFRFLSTNAPLIIPSSGIVCEMGSGLGVIASLFSALKIRTVAKDISSDACRYSSYNMRQYSPDALVVCSDWRASPFRSKFDCVVASDILYEQRWIEPVLNFLASMLSDDGAAYIADPCRQWWQEFQAHARKRGFTLDKAWQEIINQGKTKVEVMRLTFKY
jgi:predicted nicotinamide N-methyase